MKIKGKMLREEMNPKDKRVRDNYFVFVVESIRSRS